MRASSRVSRILAGVFQLAKNTPIILIGRPRRRTCEVGRADNYVSGFKRDKEKVVDRGRQKA